MNHSEMSLGQFSVILSNFQTTQKFLSMTTFHLTTEENRNVANNCMVGGNAGVGVKTL